MATVLAGLMAVSPAWAQDAGDDADTTALEAASEDVQAIENEDGTVTLIIDGQSITLDAESAIAIDAALQSGDTEAVVTAVQNAVTQVSAAAAAGGEAAADEAAAAVATFVANKATSAAQVEAATRGAIRARPTAAATVTTRVAVSAGAQRTGTTAATLSQSVQSDPQISNAAKQAANTVAQSQQPTAAPPQQRPTTPQQQALNTSVIDTTENPAQDDVSPTQ